MNRFIQLHLLTSYPPSNLNRDDLGRPKTAIMGGVNRLRISSQSLKRAWRTSDSFKEKLSNHIGTRTKEIGVEVYKKLLKGGIKETNARTWAAKIVSSFSGEMETDDKKKPLEKEEIKILENPSQKTDEEYDSFINRLVSEKKINSLLYKQLVHISPNEMTAIDELTEKVIQEKKEPTNEEIELLRKENTGADIAMFGRMLASKMAFKKEAAVQVAHAITVHKVAVEDDFFTAIDDLNKNDVDAGAGHLGDTEFGAGLFYLYICIDRQLLLENLDNNLELSKQTLSALLEACTTISPTGKQNSFASRARAMYCLAEKGNQQPRSLHASFLKQIDDKDMLAKSIEEIVKMKNNFEKVYGKCAVAEKSFNVLKGEGSLEDIFNFIQED